MIHPPHFGRYWNLHILKHFEAQPLFSEFSGKKQSFGSNIGLFEITDTPKSLPILANLHKYWHKFPKHWKFEEQPVVENSV